MKRLILLAAILIVALAGCNQMNPTQVAEQSGDPESEDIGGETRVFVGDGIRSASQTADSVGVQMPLPPYFETYSHWWLSRGFWFQAPVDFTITGLRVPDESGHGLQNVEVFLLAGEPPLYPQTASGGQVFRATGISSGEIIATSIDFRAGDYVGILGAAGDVGTMHNSMSDSADPFSSTVLGYPVSLRRFLTQTNLVASGGDQPYSGTSVGGAIGRIEVYVEASVPEADLVVTAFTADRDVVMPGESLDLSATVANLGGTDAGAPFAVRVFEKVSGHVLVSRNLPGMPAGVSRSGTVTLTAPAKAFADKVDPGIYTLVCAHDYPDGNPINDALEIQVQVGNIDLGNIGIYFDPSGTGDPLTSCEPVDYLDFVDLRVVWTNPGLTGFTGYELGWDLVGEDGQFATLVVSSDWQEDGIDFGFSNFQTGEYNYVIRYSLPRLTSPQTVLLDVQLLFLDAPGPGVPGETIYLHMRNSVPGTLPGETRPAVVAEDHVTFLPIDLPYAEGSPSLQFNGDTCTVEFAREGSWESVKRVLR